MLALFSEFMKSPGPRGQIIARKYLGRDGSTGETPGKDLVLQSLQKNELLEHNMYAGFVMPVLGLLALAACTTLYGLGLLRMQEIAAGGYAGGVEVSVAKKALERLKTMFGDVSHVSNIIAKEFKIPVEKVIKSVVENVVSQ